MIYSHLEMSGIRRMIRFPYPVRALGYIEDSVTASVRNFWTDKVEFCIRLDSEEKEAVDELNGVEYRTPFPHVIVKDFRHVHSYRINKKRKAFYLIYSKTVMLGLEAAGFDLRELVWEIRLTPRVFQLILDLRELLPKSHLPYMADRIDILSFQLLTELYSERNANRQDNTEKEKIRSIASLLQLHFTEGLDMDALISESGLSRRTFFRNWKLLYSETPRRYVERLRMQEAERLLRETSDSIREIARRLNFAGLSYFILVFRRKFGCSPGEYRRKNRNLR